MSNTTPAADDGFRPEKRPDGWTLDPDWEGDRFPRDDLQPDTQGHDPLASELGEDGEGELMPEDE